MIFGRMFQSLRAGRRIAHREKAAGNTGNMKKALVIGASGDVGRGIATALAGAGWKTAAMGRSAPRLQHPGVSVTVEGDVATPGSAAQAARNVVAALGAPDLVVVTVNGANTAQRMADLDGAAFARTFSENVVPHIEAARAFLPVMAPGGTYIAIGGGMADLVFPGTAAISAAQAAQRMVFRHLAADPPRADVRILELMLYAMIAGERTGPQTGPQWIESAEVGRHLLAVLADPEAFAGPILRLKSARQVGLPEAS